MNTRYGAGGRTRTGTLSPAVDFESTTSTNSITPAGVYCYIDNRLLPTIFYKVAACGGEMSPSFAVPDKTFWIDTLVFIDRCTCCALAASATGSARARNSGFESLCLPIPSHRQVCGVIPHATHIITIPRRKSKHFFRKIRILGNLPQQVTAQALHDALFQTGDIGLGDA